STARRRERFTAEPVARAVRRRRPEHPGGRCRAVAGDARRADDGGPRDRALSRGRARLPLRPTAVLPPDRGGRRVAAHARVVRQPPGIRVPTCCSSGLHGRGAGRGSTVSGAMLLDSVSSPADLRRLSYPELDQLCTEIREFIVEAV